MPARNTIDTYGSVSIFFHWLIFALVVCMLIAGATMDDITNKTLQSNVYVLHKSFGLTIFTLVVLRLIWKWMNPRPNFPANLSPFIKFSAKFVHFLLYICLFVMPLSGWLMSSFAHKPTNFFWLFNANLPLTVNEPLAKSIKEIHETTAWIFTGLILLHALGGLIHHYVLKDNVLKRMLGSK